MAGKFDKSALIEFFLIEAEDHIQNLTNGLLAIEKAPRTGTSSTSCSGRPIR